MRSDEVDLTTTSIHVQRQSVQRRAQEHCVAAAQKQKAARRARVTTTTNRLFIGFHFWQHSEPKSIIMLLKCWLEIKL